MWMSVMICLPYLYVHKRSNLSILYFLWQLKFFPESDTNLYLGGRCLKVLVKGNVFQFESLAWKNFSRVRIQCKLASESVSLSPALPTLASGFKGGCHRGRAPSIVMAQRCTRHPGADRPAWGGEAWQLQTAVEHTNTPWHSCCHVCREGQDYPVLATGPFPLHPASPDSPGHWYRGQGWSQPAWNVAHRPG